MSQTLKQDKLISYCILCYNHELYIQECLISILNQSYQNLEIIISDDNSSDNTWAIIQTILKDYKGSHKIKSFRNEKNLGLVKHYNRVAHDYAQGEYIIFLGGDDVANQEHAKIANEYMDKFPQFCMIDFNGIVINSDSEKINEITLPMKQKINTLKDYNELKKIHSFAPGRIFRRDLLQYFPPINPNCPTEDSVMVLRSLLLTGFLTIDEKLIKYRRHNNNISSSEGLKKMNNELIIAQYLTDLNHMYFEKKIDSETYKTTSFRILYQLKSRNLAKEQNKYKRFLKNRIIKFIYKRIK